MEALVSLPLAGIRVPCALQFPENAARLSAVPLDREACPCEPVSIPAPHWAYYATLGLHNCPDGEYTVLSAYCSEALMAHDRMIFHSVAIRWRDKAYLISAPSGVGKSTQAKHLQALCPGAFSVICGDRPVLQFCPALDCAPDAASSVIVHPSCWNGKEGWHGAGAAPLAGLIVLERGEENKICALSAREAALPVFQQCLQSYSRSDIVQTTAKMTTKLLQLVPIWKLTTHEVPDSTKLLLETVFSAPES